MLSCSFFITKIKKQNFCTFFTKSIFRQFIKNIDTYQMAFFQKQVISKIFLNIEYSAIQVSVFIVHNILNTCN